MDPDAADGDTGNDKGQGDHSEHTGPVATTEAQAQALKDAKQDWGDIIPPHDNYGGLNWDAQGQAVYNNNCSYVTGGQGGGGGGGGTTTTTTTTGGRGAAPQVTTTPTGGVGAGAGSAKQISTAGAAGLAGSIASLAGGLLWSLKRKSL